VEQATYLQSLDFEIARRNTGNYVVADVSASQGGIVLFVGSSGGTLSVPSFSDYKSPEVTFQALIENRASMDASAKRAKFRQRTFPGKPLSDDDVIHANLIASEIKDDSIIGGQLEQ
jgi:hypothetical protein